MQGVARAAECGGAAPRRPGGPQTAVYGTETQCRPEPTGAATSGSLLCSDATFREAE